MAMCSGNNALSTLASKLQLEALQSVVPIKPTEPKGTSKISLFAVKDLSSSILGRHFHIVLAYNKAFEGDSGWLLAGWIKESLAEALSDEPILAGRLRGRDENNGDLIVVSNDSGIRLIEAKVDISLAEFLSMKEKKEAEGELVFWEDVDEHNPQFFPLCYVQVTKFNCGGYTIGISCSLILADPFLIISLLKKWANIHKTLVMSKPQNADQPKIPTFYLPNLRNVGTHIPTLPIVPSNSSSTKSSSQTIVFEIGTKILNLDNNLYKNLAAHCIQEAEEKLGKKMGSNFALFVKETSENLKVEICPREGALNRPKTSTLNGLKCVEFGDVFGDEKICFNEGNEPLDVSCWINSLVDEDFVMIIACGESEKSGIMRIIVTFSS